jgi:hypothetical protein
MQSGEKWQASAEERLADAERGVQDRLKAVADHLPDPDATRAAPRRFQSMAKGTGSGRDGSVSPRTTTSSGSVGFGSG